MLGGCQRERKKPIFMRTYIHDILQQKNIFAKSNDKMRKNLQTDWARARQSGLVSYKLSSVGMPRNVFWMKYCKRAMATAFIITRGWIKSPGTWEESDWATELRNQPERNINLIVF